MGAGWTVSRGAGATAQGATVTVVSGLPVGSEARVAASLPGDRVRAVTACEAAADVAAEALAFEEAVRLYRQALAAGGAETSEVALRPAGRGFHLDGLAVPAALDDEIHLMTALDVPEAEAGPGPVSPEHCTERMRNVGPEQRPAQRLRRRKSQVFDAGEMRREASVPRVELGSLDQAARPVPEKRREAHHRERRLHEPQPSARGGRALLRIAPELAGVQHLSSPKRRELQEPGGRRPGQRPAQGPARPARGTSVRIRGTTARDRAPVPARPAGDLLPARPPDEVASQFREEAAAQIAG